MPTDGSVNPGSQNKYEPEGTIKLKDKTITYSKGDRYKNRITALDPPCWNAGTPVTLTDKTIPTNGIYSHEALETTRATIKKKNGEKIELLATMVEDSDNPGKDKAQEYHPLIQFYNTVMMGIIHDGMTRDLDNLQSPTSAARLWEYLERKYLTIENPEEFAKFLIEKRKAHVYTDEEKACLVDPKEHYSKMAYINY